jgi:hypothetical protein
VPSTATLAFRIATWGPRKLTICVAKSGTTVLLLEDLET